MVLHYETSKQSGNKHKIVDNNIKQSDFTLTVNRDKKYQKVLGFGGAFTEAAAYTFSQMSIPNQQKILQAYFNPKTGLNYNLGRICIHSSDFSLGNYTYIDDDDTELESFSIEREFKWVIPMIKAAQKTRGKTIDLLASPWSPPAWMKSNQSMNHGGELLPQYYQVWADYYIKFLQSYKEAELNVFGLTVQNEPAAKQVWDSCIYSAEQERDFIKNYLGPTLHRSGFKDTKLLIWDHNRDILVDRARTVLEDDEAKQYVWGTGFHWYVSEAFENLSELHHLFPDKHLLFTEGCIEGGVQLNRFSTGERYMRNMIGDFNHYCEGYIDWNLILNEIGGPNHVGNYCDAPIICDTQTDTVHFNSSYDAIGHFSKYLEPGARRIQTSSDQPKLNTVAFENPNKDIVVIIQNETEEDTTVTMSVEQTQTPLKISKRSMSTLIIRGEYR